MLNGRMYRRHFIGVTAAAAWAGLSASQFVWAEPAKLEQSILIVGDSLSAEYGLARGEGWVALLQARLANEAKEWQVVNASISGDTTSGGRSRLPGLLREHRPAVVVIELGANDALRGLPITSTKDNLLKMVQAAKNSGARVLLLGMQVPPNYGQRYGQDFSEMYQQVAIKEKTALLPFFLAGVADVPQALTLFQADRVHPTAKAHPQLLNTVWPFLKPLLKSASH